MATNLVSSLVPQINWIVALRAKLQRAGHFIGEILCFHPAGIQFLDLFISKIRTYLY